ncbi:MAG: hypothetical protein PHQ04_09420 [Opitutaceae bacterium]|nr:hypothetical protein [Opitutaceae bacterium]
MKKLTSLLFALVSTMFLAVGATRAADKFDTIRYPADQSMKSSIDAHGPVFDENPGLPCGILQ